MFEKAKEDFNKFCKKVVRTTNWLMRRNKDKVLITFENGKKVLFYKGCIGSVNVDEDCYHYGKLLNYKGEIVKDLIMYEGKTLKALEKDFKEAIKQYPRIIKKGGNK